MLPINSLSVLISAGSYQAPGDPFPGTWEAQAWERSGQLRVCWTFGPDQAKFGTRPFTRGSASLGSISPRREGASVCSRPQGQWQRTSEHEVNACSVREGPSRRTPPPHRPCSALRLHGGSPARTGGRECFSSAGVRSSQREMPRLSFAGACPPGSAHTLHIRARRRQHGGQTADSALSPRLWTGQVGTKPT